MYDAKRRYSDFSIFPVIPLLVTWEKISKKKKSVFLFCSTQVDFLHKNNEWMTLHWHYRHWLIDFLPITFFIFKFTALEISLLIIYLLIKLSEAYKWFYFDDNIFLFFHMPVFSSRIQMNREIVNIFEFR